MKSISFKHAFALVLGVHALVVVFFLASSGKARAEVIKKEDQKFLTTKEAQFCGIDVKEKECKLKEEHKSPVVAKPQQASKPMMVPEPKVIAKPKEPIKQQGVKQVIIQKNDTLYRISKKYSIPVSKIIKLNNLKNDNKIIEGQKLKLQ